MKILLYFVFILLMPTSLCFCQIYKVPLFPLHHADFGKPRFQMINPQMKYMSLDVRTDCLDITGYSLSRSLTLRCDSVETFIPVLLAFDPDSNYIMVIDKNLNNDFCDDHLYKMNQDAAERKTEMNAISDSVFIEDLGQYVYFRFNFVKPGYIGQGLEDELENNLFLMVNPNYLVGKMMQFGNEYNLVLKPKSLNFNRDVVLHIVEHKDFEEARVHGISSIGANPGDTIMIGPLAFVFKEFLAKSYEVVLETLPDRKFFGKNPGFYVSNFVFRNVLGNKSVVLNDLKDDYVLLDFWGTWCEPCKRITPDLVSLERKYKRRLEIISIAVESEKDDVIKYVKKTGMRRWAQHLDHDQGNGTLVDQFEVSEFPTFILVEPGGRILFRGTGQDGFNIVGERLEELLD